MAKILRTYIAVLFVFLFFFHLNADVYQSVVYAASYSPDSAARFFSKGEAQFSEIYNPGIRDSRQNWLDCASNFKKAYDCDPDGDYGPVSLYLYGKVYRDLYRFSNRSEDLDTAFSALKKVVSSYPSSTYSHKAASELEGMSSLTASALAEKSSKDKSSVSSKKTDTESGKTASGASAKKDSNVTSSDQKNSSKKTDAVSSSKAPKKTEIGSGDENRKSDSNPGSRESRPKDKDTGSVKRTPDITGIRHWTENGYTRVVIDIDSKASYRYSVDKNGKDGLDYLVVDFQNCGVSKDVKRERTFNGRIVKNASIVEKAGNARVQVGLTASSNFNVFPISGQDDNLKYRIVIDVKGSSDNESEVSKNKKTSVAGDDKSKGDDKGKDDKPEKNEPVKTDSKTTEKPDKAGIEQKKSGDGLKTQEKTSPDQPEKTEIEPVDISGTDYDAQLKKSERNRVKPAALAKQLALGVRRIVVDPGHGGRDPGAMAQQEIREKDITLSLAKKLAQSLRNRTGCEVVLTRSSDAYLHLEERTAIANTRKADLFISLHLNSSPAREVMGVETYFLNLATDESAIAVAARENATSTKNISDLEGILKDLMRNAKIAESSRLAKYVQKNICVQLSKKFTPVKDKGVKQAPFYVLMGAQMPAILIETGFISNAQELSRLNSSDYQTAMCDAIASGIAQYISTVSGSPSYSGKAAVKKSATGNKTDGQTVTKKTEKKKNTSKNDVKTTKNKNETKKSNTEEKSRR